MFVLNLILIFFKKNFNVFILYKNYKKNFFISQKIFTKDLCKHKILKTIKWLSKYLCKHNIYSVYENKKSPLN